MVSQSKAQFELLVAYNKALSLSGSLMIKFIFVLLTLVGSVFVHATQNAEQLAKNYLKTLLNKDYENLYKYINVEQFNNESHLTITNYLSKKVEDGKLSKAEKDEFELKLFEQGLTKEDLDEGTVKDLLTYFFVEMYRINSGSFGGKVLGEIDFLTVAKDKENKEHYVFNVRQMITDEDNPDIKREFTSTELVSVKYLDGKPVIIHPAKVIVYVELIAKDFLKLGGE